MNDPNITVIEITRASKLADKIEGNEKLKKRLVRLIFLFLTLIFIGFLTWGINKVLLTEGTEAMPEVYKDSITPLPQTGEGAVALFEKLLSKTSDKNATKVSLKTSLNLDKESLTVTNDEKWLIKESLNLLKDEILDNLARYYADASTGFGESFNDLLLPISFTASNLKDWEANEDGENINLLFEFPAAQYNAVTENIKSSLGMNEAEGFTSYVKQRLLPEFEIRNINLTCGELTIAVNANRLTDRLSSIIYKRAYITEVAVRFGGDLERLGERKLSFVFTSTTQYNFTWAGITLSDRVIWLEKGKTDVIEAYRTADELIDVTWSSSNDSIVSVDCEGYIKGDKTSPYPVTITASFYYLGKTYTADCLVYAVVPVKDAKLNKPELLLKAGQSETLAVDILPKKATVKEVCWFTTDEKVAVVDENGKVTAVAGGVCKVYFITKNMNYKRSCIITVEG